MRNKLQKFNDFTNSLLPHETEYLLTTQQFEDEKRLEILKEIDHNCRNIFQFTPYDEKIDKRKFSNLKTWITERLSSIDVDAHFEWMSQLERKIMTDSILPEEEKQLLRTIRQYEHPSFYFVKFFELVQHYRHFLLIRLRYVDHELADQFIKKYDTAYQHCRSINDKLHQATLDIVNQYASDSSESIQWDRWLSEVFFDEQLDGHNRYLALVRLIFIGFNYRNFEPLLEKFDYLDRLFREGRYYSKRLLLNYYSNRLLLHSKFQEFDKAAYYGYLSIRSKNHDYLFYATNLAAVLLRQDKKEEALRIMREAYPEMKVTQNFHNKVGFVAFFIKCLNKNERYKNAENYASSFLRAYKKEIFEYRWHIFFTAYLETLMAMKDYKKMIRLIRQNRLLELEKKYKRRANYLPTLLWYNAVAEYKELMLDEEGLYQLLSEHINTLRQHPDRAPQVTDLLQELKEHIPRVVNRLLDHYSRKEKLLSSFM
ncbi:MAG: hypothetical protein H6563_10490 [Lewinellaceae bacterium]|nr:hypothetical protein [Lewinellaceae bacterium]